MGKNLGNNTFNPPIPSLKMHTYHTFPNSLRLVLSGKLVTGARFVKRGKVFHLQIQQALALPEGISDSFPFRFRG